MSSNSSSWDLVNEDMAPVSPLSNDHAESLPPKTMPIAIIGMGCRFPGDATDTNTLWDLCVGGRSAWSQVPQGRFNNDAWYHPDDEHVGTSFVKGGYFLSEDISQFDASFFNFSSEVAGAMDPEVRMLLECAYEAFESAGLTMKDVTGSNMAVCAGTCFRDFHDSHLRDPSTLSRFYLTGNGMAMISNRVSHFFDLRGPSIAVDTGCSTTLTLLHLACQSLRNGDAETALVGGSNALINPDMFISGTILGLLSPEGKCFAFDSRASGYGRGEGAAALILKPLEAAVRDGDPIRAVIRETTLNQDGRTPTLTSPSRAAQEELMRKCYESAGLNPRNTGYVEAHGTGTQAGDTSEAAAIGAILGLKDVRGESIAVGSIKTHIGHTEASSGLAGVFSAVMAIEKGYIAPNPNFDRPNPNIPFEDLNIKVSASTQQWPETALRRASVNNFGYGGSNAHVIIEHPDYLVPYYRNKLHLPKAVHDSSPDRLRILKVSAKSETSTISQLLNIQSYVKNQVSKGEDLHVFLDRLVYTLGQKRSTYSWSSAISFSTTEEIVNLEPVKPHRATQVPRIGFVFSGQGAQWYAMGRELIAAYSVFERALQEADSYLQELGASWSLIEELCRDEKTTRINEVIISLPSCVAIQLALIKLLQSWGINAAGVTSHSSGEVAAAFAAGVIDMKAALTIVYTRGSLTTAFQKLISRRGGMVAVGLSREEVQPYLDSLEKGQVVIACINSPSSVTVSGDLAAIEEVQEILSQKNIFVRRLRVDAAYHSHHMLGIADAYYDALSSVLPKTTSFSTDLVYSSPVTGNRVSSANDIVDPSYWVKNMVQPVEFLDSLTNLCLGTTSSIELANVSDVALPLGSSSVDILLEVGPHATLQGPARQVLSQPTLKDAGISYLSCLRRGQNAVSTMHGMVCSLLEHGYPVSLDAVNFPQGMDNFQVLTDLPPYPWNHQVSHWVESRVNKTLRNRKFPVHDLLGISTLDSNPFVQQWKHIIRLSEMPWIRDHQVQTDIVYPGAGYISMAIEASRQAYGKDHTISKYQIRRVEIIKALIIPQTNNGVEVQVCLQPCSSGTLESGWQQFQILSVDENDTWSIHCEGQILIVHKAVVAEKAHWTDAKEVTVETQSSLQAFPLNLDVEDFYGSLRRMGLNHGPLFRNITSIRAGSGTSSCVFKIADPGSTMPCHFQQEHILHPTTLDSIFQAVYTALTATGGGGDVALLPRSIRSMSVSQDICTQPTSSIVVHSTMKKLSSRGFESDAIASVTTSSDSNQPILEINGLFCQLVGPAVSPAPAGESRICFTTVWEPDMSLLGPKELGHLISTGKPLVNAKRERHYDALLEQQTHEANGSPDTSTESVVRTILKYLTHKTRHPQVFELGATSGYITKITLDFLHPFYTGNSAQLTHYTLTDTFNEDLIAAKENFSDYGDLLSTKQVNLEHSYATQDLAPESYDLVMMQADDIESNETFNVQELVKPGGILLIFDSRYTERTNKIASKQLDAEFESIDFDIVSSSMKLTLAIRNQIPAPAVPLDIAVLHGGPAPSQEWLDQLGEAIDRVAASKATIKCASLTDMDGAAGRSIIFMDDPDRSILTQPSGQEFEAIKRSLIDAKGVLWVSRGGTIDCKHPSAGIHTGLLRTLRCEYPFKRYISLDLERDSSDWQTSDISSIGKVFKECFDWSPSSQGTSEAEFAVRNGLIYIPRVIEDVVQNDNISNDDKSDESLPFFDPGRKIRLGVRKAGLLDSLVFVDDETTTGQLPPDQVEIKPAAFGLNFRDIMVAMGQLDETRMGFECSGFISAVGSEAAARGLQVGDRVYAFLRGYFANNIRVHHSSVAKVPEGMDMETAASIPLVFITAYQSLHNMARLKKGETVLIHSGTGGVGQAAIMLAQLIGAEIFVTVGSKEKKQFLVSTYDIPEDHIFNSRSAKFVEGIMAATKGKGIDVVLNSLAGPLLAATWNCIAPFGRFIELGKRDLELNNTLEMGPFVRSVSFASLDLITLGELRGEDVARMLAEIDVLLREGLIRAVSPITKFQISEAEKAYRLMQGGKHMGKIVLVPSENDLVKVSPSDKSVKLSADCTYLIVGGLGGIGRSITEWMVERGARNLVLLSRNAQSLAETTPKWLQNLEERGARLLVQACDAADKEQLAASLQRLQSQLPPIKGVIQAAMVLRDTLFDTMTLSDYETAVRPKVQGSWNLHELLPTDLDFFVMLSSISGFGGNASQANYAAGGTFQDALARHRTSIGQRATSIDLGMVKGIGAMAGAEARKLASRIERMGIRALSKDQVLRLVEASIRTNRDVASSQLITGIPPSWVRPESDNNQEIQSTNAFWIRDPRFSPLETSSRDSKDVRQDDKANLVSMLGDVSISNREITVAVAKALRSKLASMFIMPETDIDTAAPPARLGVDSLIAVELRNWISATMRSQCSVFDILQTPSLDSLAAALVQKSPLRTQLGNVEEPDVPAKLVDGVNGHT